jgi:hypothetical protein
VNGNLGDTISGGQYNTITDTSYATIIGGYANQITLNGDFSSILGGRNNRALGTYATAGGFETRAQKGSWIWQPNRYAPAFPPSGSDWYDSHADYSFNVRAFGGVFFDSGTLTIDTQNYDVGPDSASIVTSSSVYMNGGCFHFPDATSLCSAPTGGAGETGYFANAKTFGSTLTVQGQDGSGYSLNLSSSITTGGCYKFGDASIQCSAATSATTPICAAGAGTDSVLCSGSANTTAGNYASIGGGTQNSVTADYGTIGGGNTNSIGAFAYHANISGGAGNSINGFSENSTIVGGRGNYISGLHSTVLGGLSNSAVGNYALAAGRRSKALNNGSFSFTDSQDADYGPALNDSIAMRFQNGGQFDLGFSTFTGPVKATLFEGDGSLLTNLPPEADFYAGAKTFGSTLTIMGLDGSNFVSLIASGVVRGERGLWGIPYEPGDIGIQIGTTSFAKALATHGDLVVASSFQQQPKVNFHSWGGTAPGVVRGYRSRGNWDNPVSCSAGDGLLGLGAYAYDGAAFSAVGGMALGVDTSGCSSGAGCYGMWGLNISTGLNSPPSLALLVNSGKNLGIGGTATPKGRLDVGMGRGNTYSIVVSSQNGNTTFGVDNFGHITSSATTAPVLTACTNGTLNTPSTDMAGVVKMSGTVSSCQITFGNPFKTNQVVCLCNTDDGSASGNVCRMTGVSSTGFSMNPHPSATFGSGDRLTWFCMGVGQP